MIWGYVHGMLDVAYASIVMGTSIRASSISTDLEFLWMLFPSKDLQITPKAIQTPQGVLWILACPRDSKISWVYQILVYRWPYAHALINLAQCIIVKLRVRFPVDSGYY